MFAVVETLYVMARGGVVAAPGNVHVCMKKAILAPNCTQAVFTKYMYDQQSLRFSENSEVTGDKDSADSDSKTCTSGSTSSLAYDIRRYISIMNISWSLIISLK